MGQGAFPIEWRFFAPMKEAQAWDPEPYEYPVVYFDVLGLRAGKDELDSLILSNTRYVVLPHWMAIVFTGLLPLLWLVARVVRRSKKLAA